MNQDSIEIVVNNLQPRQKVELFFPSLCKSGQTFDKFRAIVNACPGVSIGYIEEFNSEGGLITPTSYTVEGLKRVPMDILIWLLRSVDHFQIHPFPKVRDLVTGDDVSQGEAAFLLADQVLTSKLTDLVQDDGCLVAWDLRYVQGEPILVFKASECTDTEDNPVGILTINGASETVSVNIGGDIWHEEYSDPGQVGRLIRLIAKGNSIIDIEYGHSLHGGQFLFPS